jgi:hypothetical protein
MKKFFMRKRAAVLGLVACLAIAGAAIAYWTQNGSGTGSATAGDTQAIEVVQDSLTANNLYPGGPDEALSGHFENPNAHPVHIGGVTAEVVSVSNGAANVDAAHPACTKDDFEITGSTAAYTVSENDDTTWSGLGIQLKETGANQDNCKGATANIKYTANAGS